jgi:hypothetical protein
MGSGGRPITGLAFAFHLFPPLLFMPRYDDYSREELVRLLEARDRRDATRFGLVWETNVVFGLGRGQA